MAKMVPGNPDKKSLREVAEQRIVDFPHRWNEFPADDKRLLQELQVHQIEVEIQNENLRSAKDEISSLLDYSELYEFAPVGYLSLNRNGEILKCNLTAARLFGVERSRLLNSSMYQLFTRSSQELFSEFLCNWFSGKGAAASSLACLNSSGRVAWIQIAASNFEITKDCRVVVTDISLQKRNEDERRQLESDLQQSQKMESLGILSAGIAHDVNNVLAAISAVVETQSKKPNLDPDLVSALDIVAKATRRGRDLVIGLTAFSRKELLTPEPTNLNALIHEEVGLLQRSTLQKIVFNLDLVDPPPFVLAEKSQLSATLMNLCVNAISAMPNGGELTLRTVRGPESVVTLTIEDSGTAMSPEVLRRCLDPFFTTKAIGMGSGLGLSTAYSTAKSHGGSLLIDSAPGKGTSVTLKLPELLAVEIIKPAKDLSEGPIWGSKSMLLVDDDELIRASIPDFLETLGHKVESVATGWDALSWIENHPKVDVVLLDMNMPEMDGLETLRILRMNRPQLPVLFATGNIGSVPLTLMQNDPWVQVIGKPFFLQDFESALSRFQRLD